MSTTVYTYNDKVLVNSANDKWLKKKEGPNYNPYNLPAKTFRVKLGSSWSGDPSITVTQVEGDIYDVTFPSDSAINSFSKSAVTGLLGANGTGLTAVPNALTSLTGTVGNLYLPDTTSLYNFFPGSSITSIGAIYAPNVTNMQAMFTYCTSLTSVPLFDTSNVTNMQSMFAGCSSLTSVPLFDTSKVTNMGHMFHSCTNVESGALALYQQASSQTTPPSDHTDTFTGCGYNTVTGAAELAQIPSSWGGTAS